MSREERKLLILYASQTGYCIDTAERIKREGIQRHFQVEILSMNEFDVHRLPIEKLIVFVCSVTGQGVEPDTMKVFWKFLLRKDLPANSLSALQFGVFGQGDSSYAKFNFPAKKLYKRLLQLGGNALVYRGDGDDQHDLGVDGALDPWLTNWWTECLRLYPIPKGMEIIPNNVLPLNSYQVEILANDPLPELMIQHPLAAVSENTRITSETHFQDVRHYEFSVENSLNSPLYKPGDVFQIFPQNRADKVQDVLDYFGWNEIADKPLKFTPNPALPPLSDTKIPYYLRSPISLRQLFEYHLNIFGRPRRYFFELLSFFALDAQHAEKLREFASTEGQSDLYAYSHKMKRTIFEVLTDFSSVKLPLKYLVDLIPAFQPRSFSISSSPLVHGNTIHLTVAIVNYKTKLKADRVGVCTDWMANLSTKDLVRYSFARGTLRLPQSLDVPIICIGPGTGIAPMRSLILERCQQAPSVTNCLILGCRSKKDDFYYQELWQSIKNLDLITAFSRDQPEKVYVQHKIIENGKKLWHMIHEQGAYIYLSGNANQIPTQVAEALCTIFMEHGGLDSQNAETYLLYLTKEKRYQEECWS